MAAKLGIFLCLAVSAAEDLRYAGSPGPWGGSWGLGTATLRKEDLAGLYATKYREGIVVTRPLIALGTKLEINAKCAPGGSVGVEVAVDSDQVVGSCSKDLTDAFMSNSVSHTVTWGGDPTIPVGEDERSSFRKVRFFLRDAEML